MRPSLPTTPRQSPRAAYCRAYQPQHLLANDSDPEDDTLTITAVGSAVNGTVTLSEDKATVTYAHDGSETTSGSFTYTVSDGSAADTATVEVTVTPVNAAPVAVDDTATVDRGQ